MSIAENILKVKSELPEGVRLVAVSKTKPAEAILEAYEAGQRCFGENRAQEMAAKYPVLPSDIEWHFIGHLQTNKVKYIAPFVSMIESVDSLKLLDEIDREAARNHRIISCLLQFHIAEEETKFGLSVMEAEQLLDGYLARPERNIRICGVMGMATFTRNMEQVRREFRYLREIFVKLKKIYFESDPAFCEISMGMSDDFQTAIEEGSTIVRIGSRIFGHRTGPA
jgi:pyridoxal phosphate enzyme (YggS family)